ncbi:metalloproteinase inhibitor 3-like [Crassostrea virginica]
MKVCFSVLIGMVAYLTGTDACSCMRLEPQALYCNSEFVVIGKITGKSFDKRIIVYDVEVTKVYRGDVSKGSIKIKTAESDTVCGVDLDVNKVYLLNGYLQNNEMWIGTCETISSSPINDPGSVFPLDTYYDCRCIVLNRYLIPGDERPKKNCLIGSRFRCSPDSGALGDLAECRYNEAEDDCAWQC